MKSQSLTSIANVTIPDIQLGHEVDFLGLLPVEKCFDQLTISSCSTDSECITLSLAALEALEDFKRDQQEPQEEIREDWQLSQFWYSIYTRETICQEIIRKTAAEDRIACISSPSIFTWLMKDRESVILEFDRRFAKYEQFIFYDFNNPLDISPKLFHSFDYVVVDPPFLSDECFKKSAQTAKLLLKPGGKIMVCTGEVMEQCVFNELGCEKVEFRPDHTNGLSNSFGCFLNYASDNAFEKSTEPMYVATPSIQ